MTDKRRKRDRVPRTRITVRTKLVGCVSVGDRNSPPTLETILIIHPTVKNIIVTYSRAGIEFLYGYCSLIGPFGNRKLGWMARLVL